MERILSETSLVAIPYVSLICLTYTMMFFGTATAFVWQGLIDYMQVELGISDAELILQPFVLMNRHEFKLADDSTYFYFEWDPQLKNPVPHVVGPLCDKHRRYLDYQGKEGAGYRWVCINPEKKKDQHSMTLAWDSIDIRQESKIRAENLLKAELERSASRNVE